MLHRALTHIYVYKDTNCIDLCTSHCKSLGEGSVWTSRNDLCVLLFENSVLILWKWLVVVMRISVTLLCSWCCFKKLCNEFCYEYFTKLCLCRITSVFSVHKQRVRYVKLVEKKVQENTNQWISVLENCRIWESGESLPVDLVALGGNNRGKFSSTWNSELIRERNYNSSSWDAMLCSWGYSLRRFEWLYRIYLQNQLTPE